MRDKECTFSGEISGDSEFGNSENLQLKSREYWRILHRYDWDGFWEWKAGANNTALC